VNVDTSGNNNHKLELKLVGIDYRLDTSEEILKEIKNVLVEQNKTIVEIVKIQERQQNQESNILRLQNDFCKQNEEYAPIFDEFRLTKGKIMGIVAASSFFIIIIQICIGYIISNAFERINRIEQLASTVIYK